MMRLLVVNQLLPCCILHVVPFYIFELLIADAGQADGRAAAVAEAAAATAVTAAAAAATVAVTATTTAAAAAAATTATATSTAAAALALSSQGATRHRSSTHAAVDAWAAKLLYEQEQSVAKEVAVVAVGKSKGVAGTVTAAGAVDTGDAVEADTDDANTDVDTDTDAADAAAKEKVALGFERGGRLAALYEVPPLFKDKCAMCVPRALREASTDGVFLMGPKRSG